MIDNKVDLSVNHKSSYCCPLSERSRILDKKIKAAVLAVFALLGATAIFTLCATNMITPNWIGVGVALTAISFFSTYYAITAIDYENPEVLKRLQEEANLKPFSSLLKKHGIKNLERYLFKDRDWELIEKFREELKGEITWNENQTATKDELKLWIDKIESKFKLYKLKESSLNTIIQEISNLKTKIDNPESFDFENSIKAILSNREDASQGRVPEINVPLENLEIG